MGTLAVLVGPVREGSVSTGSRCGYNRKITTPGAWRREGPADHKRHRVLSSSNRLLSSDLLPFLKFLLRLLAEPSHSLPSQRDTPDHNLKPSLSFSRVATSL